MGLRAEEIRAWEADHPELYTNQTKLLAMPADELMGIGLSFVSLSQLM